MKATNSLKVKSVLAIVLIAVELFAQLTAFHADALAAPALALPDGMSLGAQLTQDDLAYLQDSLQYLRDQLPNWWQYVAEATPVTLALDSSLDANGRAAVADCCDERGYGLITVGQHFEQLAASYRPSNQTVKAQRVIFLGLIIHEVTHVRDQRAGRFTTKTDRKSCIAAESSGLSQELRFKRDLAAKLADDPAADAAFKTWLDEQIKIEASELRSRATWDLYCGAFEE